MQRRVPNRPMRSSRCRRSAAPRSAADPAATAASSSNSSSAGTRRARLVILNTPSSAGPAGRTPTRSPASAVVAAPGRTAASRCTRSTVMGESSGKERAPEACNQPVARKRSAVSRSRGVPALRTHPCSRGCIQRFHRGQHDDGCGGIGGFHEHGTSTPELRLHPVEPDCGLRVSDRRARRLVVQR